MSYYDHYTVSEQSFINTAATHGYTGLEPSTVRRILGVYTTMRPGLCDGYTGCDALQDAALCRLSGASQHDCIRYVLDILSDHVRRRSELLSARMLDPDSCVPDKLGLPPTDRHAPCGGYVHKRARTKHAIA